MAYKRCRMQTFPCAIPFWITLGSLSKIGCTVLCRKRPRQHKPCMKFGPFESWDATLGKHVAPGVAKRVQLPSLPLPARGCFFRFRGEPQSKERCFQVILPWLGMYQILPLGSAAFFGAICSVRSHKKKRWRVGVHLFISWVHDPLSYNTCNFRTGRNGSSGCETVKYIEKTRHRITVCNKKMNSTCAMSFQAAG